MCERSCTFSILLLVQFMWVTDPAYRTQISFPEPSPCGRNGMEWIGILNKNKILLICFLSRRELLRRPFLDLIVRWVKDRLFLFTLWAINESSAFSHARSPWLCWHWSMLALIIVESIEEMLNNWEKQDGPLYFLNNVSNHFHLVRRLCVYVQAKSLPPSTTAYSLDIPRFPTCPRASVK